MKHGQNVNNTWGDEIDNAIRALDHLANVGSVKLRNHSARLGAEFIEAHHKLPLSEVKEETAVKASDLAMLCANCHRMIHRGEGTDVPSLAQVVANRGSIVSAANLSLLASTPG